MSTPAVSGQGATQRFYTIKALTDIWTGDADGEGERLITTGLLGSIRWWFEVLVRGLGGSACDPSFEDRKKYPRSSRCPDPQVNEPTKDGHHCVVCQLFGCTGWARKFRFQVLEGDDNLKKDQIKKGQTFKLVFTELRSISPEEWALLDLTLRLIADYGAIGGRTVFKPSDEPGLADLALDDFEEQTGQMVVRQSRQGLPLQRGNVLLTVGGVSVRSKKDLEDKILRGKKHGEPVIVTFLRNGKQHTQKLWYGKRHHQDLGLIAITESPQYAQIKEEELRRVINSSHWRRVDHGDFAWASLENFWCVKGRYLARQNANASTFNRAIGRKEQKNRSQRLRNNPTDADRWLAGSQQESKKVFSFKEPEEARRTFGFVKPGLIDFDAMKDRLKCVWSNFGDNEFLKGEDILAALFITTVGGAP